MNQLLTVLITTHNRCNLLKRSVESVVHQTYSPIEIIVINDGSSDNTDAVMQEILTQYPQVISLKNETPKGACNARNLGLDRAQGYYLAILDDDDYWLPERAEKLIQAFTEDSAYVFSGAFRQYPNHRTTVTARPKFSYQDMLEYGNMNCSPALSKTEYFRQAGGFDPTLPSWQDYDMWLRLLEIKPFAYGVAEPLMVIDASDRTGRISVSRKKAFRGKFLVYQKFKTKMEPDVRNALLYEIRKILHPIPQLRHIFWLCPKKKRLKEFRRYIKNNLLKVIGKKPFTPYSD